MIRATIFLAMGWWLAAGATHVASGLAFAQTVPAQPPSQSSATPGATPPASPETAAPKPCPAGSPSQSGPQTDCKPASKTKKPKSNPPAAPGSAPRKRVVDNGDITEPRVDISPGVNPQQAQQQRGRTTWLLGKTDENLKILASRTLNAAQQDTVHQVKRYVDDSAEATKNGDLQRAYTLANKARMLSADLVKH
jgi:hypothetical protein